MTEFYQHLLVLSSESPEDVGFTDFTIEGRHCDLEVLCSPRSRFYSCITIDRKVVRAERETLITLLHDLVTDDEIDDLRAERQIRFYPPVLMPNALYNILTRVCGCPEGAPLQIEQWWS